MKKATLINIALFIVWLLPFIYLFVIYTSLPVTMPLHYGIDGEPDRWGSRSHFIWLVIGLQAVAALSYLLIRFLPSIDPKRKARYSQQTFSKLGWAMLLFITILNVTIIYGSVHKDFKLHHIFFPMIGLFFAYIGNTMHSIKPNYFVGIRTPWTLESEDTWRKTHQLAGKIWLPGGILITIVTLLLSPRGSYIFLAVMVAVMAIIPIVYSYIYFKKRQTNP